MANSFTKTVVQEGVRNFIVQLNGVLDSSDQPSTTVISPSDCTYYIPKNFRIDQIRYDITDQLQVYLWWDGTPDALIVPLAGRGKFCFTGGLQNAAYAPPGSISISTTGYISGIQTYAMVIDLVKINVNNRT